MMPDSTPALRRAEYWQEIAQRRMRLVVLALIVGLVAGFVMHAVIAAPPVWIDQLPAPQGCMSQ